ncbi:MAG: translocation/assembly module TamB [Candidatus Mariimomonas ferrooxydans]
MGIKLFQRLFPNRLMRRLAIVFTAIFFIAVLFFLLRGPYLSNSIKRVIQPVLENAIGERIIIERAVINLFPFYLQTKGFKVFDKEGNRLLWVTKMRAYIDLLGLFSKEIRIRRLTVKEPDLVADREKLDRIIGSTEKYALKDSGKKFIISLKSAKVTDGRFILTDSEKERGASGSGLNADIVIGDAVNIRLSLKDGTLKMPGLPGLTAGFDGRIRAKGRKIKILEAKIYSADSSIEAKGDISLSSEGRVEHGSLSGEARIFAQTIGRTFGMEQTKDGELSFSGSVELVPVQGAKNSLEGPKFKYDLKTKSNFYLETLMKLLKVNGNITGRVSIDGEIRGVYPELTGGGMIDAGDVVLGRLALNDIKGKIRYKDRRFSLDEFTAHTYGGELHGSAFLLIPSAYYSVEASVANINSLKFFKFIKWEPPFAGGRVSGAFKLNKKRGRKINLTAEAFYLNTSENIKNLIIDRLRNFKTELELKEGILTLNNAVLSTSVSGLFLDGRIDLNRKRLDLNLEMESRDVSDLTNPYFSGVRAPVRFIGRAQGPAKNPEISGRIEAGPGSVNGEPFTEVSGDLTYSPKYLSVRFLKAVQGDSVYEVAGSIAFRKAGWLFSFNDPYYKAEANIKNGDAGSLVAAAYKKMPITGFVNGELFFEGDAGEFRGSGDIALKEGVVFGQPVDLASIRANLSPGEISFSSVEVYKNESKLVAGGSLSFDERFEALISSDSIYLRDLAILDFDRYPFDANFSLNIKGSGTFKNPDVKFSLNIPESYFRDALIGKGQIAGELKGKKLFIKSDFPEGIVTADARAILSGTLPWDVSIKLKRGRYDFLLAGFMEDVPRDLSASLEGSVDMKRERDKISVNARFSSLNFGLYGYNFNNNKDIVMELDKDIFRVKSFSIRGGHGDITASGEIKLGQSYDLKLNGEVDLTPLKAVTKTIKYLKGQGSFAVAISGIWKSPELTGEINIRDSTIMIEGFPYRIGPVNGDVFLDKDRVTFDFFNTAFAGGRVDLSGAGFLKGLSLNGLTISSKMKGIKFRHVEGVNIAFDGKLFFETSQKKQRLLGDINIKSARYDKRVEWKSGLLQLKRVKEAPVDKQSFFGKTMLNIHIAGRDNIFIDNNIVRMPVEVDLNVQGTIAQYGLIGRLETNEGAIFFRGNEFEIIDGSVDFIETNRIVPVFHIQAETFTRGYRIRLNLDGPSDKFAMSLFSDPPLTDMDILTLLTTGRISEEAKGFESGIGTGEATAFLTGRMQDVIEEKFKYITGFERFEVDPYTTTAGAVSQKITVGKRLLEDKLFVTYSTLIGTTEEHIIKLQYNLSKNLSIIGLRNEIGSIGADFKYRFEFR